jgi:hypothetical protein
MPRFVLLEHDWPEPHWDFLLEAGAVLRAWRLAAAPRLGSVVAAHANFDHRLFYLDYEGPVSGGRGHVTRWDQGTFAWLLDEPERVIVRVAGARLQGTVELHQLAGVEWRCTLTASVPFESHPDG